MHQTDLYLQKLITEIIIEWMKWKLEWKDKTKPIHLCSAAKESLIVDKMQSWSSVARVYLFFFFIF